MPSALEGKCFAFAEDSFYEVLCNKYCPRDAVRSLRQAQELYAYLKQFPAKTIVVEENYFDGDYMEDFASFHVRAAHHVASPL